mgnify:CR=1 FL=1
MDKKLGDVQKRLDEKKQEELKASSTAAETTQIPTGETEPSSD